MVSPDHGWVMGLRLPSWTHSLCPKHNGRVITSLNALAAIGPSVFDVVVPGTARPVDDVFLADPGSGAVGAGGDLVLALGVGPADALDLVRRCADAGSAGLVLRDPGAHAPPVRAAAERHGLTLAALSPDVAWAHVVWLLRGVIDRAVAPDAPAAGEGVIHDDLFALADAVAALAGAPATIEDNRSRVLAYSSGQAATDSARVSTIVGRRMPPELVAHFRAAGVFRRLATSSEPFLVPEGPDGIRPRLVVPVRAGDEWLGSIWLVVTDQPEDRVVRELRHSASILALHLLQLRAQADVARRSAAERLRVVLRDGSAGVTVPGLPPGPWRVVALGSATDLGAAHRLDLWTAVCRRHGWTEPDLADLNGTVVAVVTDHGGAAGSWAWLRRLVEGAHLDDPALHAAAGRPRHQESELPASRAEAEELLRLMRRRSMVEPARTHESAWPELTLSRAAAPIDVAALGGPVAALLQHDAARGTPYAPTLRAWLAHPGNPRKAAAELHIHPNTLRHRMGRLSETVELGLDDPAYRLAIQIQLEAALGPP